MARRRVGAAEPMTALEHLQIRMAAKRELLDRIGEAHDAGDQAEADRLNAEFEALYVPSDPAF